MKVSNEEEWDISQHAGECEDGECLENWMKLDSWISSWKDDHLEVQDAGSCFLKLWRESLSLKETLVEGALKTCFMERFEEEGE